jgi:hypothetical protein
MGRGSKKFVIKKRRLGVPEISLVQDFGQARRAYPSPGWPGLPISDLCERFG